MKHKEVIVLFGDKVVRVSEQAWRDVMDAAGQMRDDWMSYAKETGTPLKRATAGLDALKKLDGLVR